MLNAQEQYGNQAQAEQLQTNPIYRPRIEQDPLSAPNLIGIVTSLDLCVSYTLMCSVGQVLIPQGDDAAFTHSLAILFTHLNI